MKLEKPPITEQFDIELVKLDLIIEEKKGKTIVFKVKSKSSVEKYIGK